MITLEIAIIACGLAGNFESFYVFWRIRKYTNELLDNLNPNYMFMLKLIVDSFYLILQIPTIQPMYFLMSNSVCKIQVTLTYVLQAYSAWILVFVSIERLVSVTHSQNILTNHIAVKKNQFIDIVGILIVLFALYSPAWNVYFSPDQAFSLSANNTFLSKNNTNLAYCYIPDGISNIVYQINLLTEIMIPFLFLMVSSVLIIYSMRVLRNRLRIASSRRENRDLDYAFVILSLGIIFLFLNFPYGVLLTLTSIDFNFMIKFIFYYFHNLSYSINIFIYMAVNRSFRIMFITQFIELDETSLTVS
jgi:hypothetical protein